MEVIESKWYNKEWCKYSVYWRRRKTSKYNLALSVQKISVMEQLGDNYIYIWAIEDIVAYNNDYGIHKYLQKEYLAFGMDGDIGYIFHLPNNSIYRVDLGDLDIASIKYIAPSFDDFLGKAIYLNFDKPQNIVDNSSTI